ncbi:PREDICTED: WAT1-related protein At1g09380 [Theobroma cacao]|uniref:WAT1-related protein n=1 Tax=Theobroma cacao TaxID=3641 RepID=A0AB32WAQ2_THECC|nr:PREDICTED: WAT1-related protein At1g09380 [Theobroma cacao]
MLGDFVPFLANVLVQLGYAGMNITSKLAMESGMKPLILVAYRQIFATLAIAPFAYFLERKTRPKITKHILFQIFLCSLTGATANQVFYFVGLENSSATVACALNNVLPAATFALAALCRQEAVGIKKASGQAKVLGTLVCVGGAMLLSFYHGHTIGIGDSSIHWAYADKMTSKSSSNGSNFFLGPFLVMASAVAWAVWLIIQGQTSKNFPAPYTCTALMCFMASIECTIIGIFSDHKISAWSLSSSMRLIAALYAGIVCNAMTFCVLSWSIQKKGPLYVSVFSPLLLVIVAVLSWALLREKLYVGTVVGSVLIVGGLYAVLWGKDREIKQMKSNQLETAEEATKAREKDGKDDLELQLHPQTNGTPQAA